MNAPRVLDTSRVEIKLGPYGVAPATALMDSSLQPQVQDYRRLAGLRMYPLAKEDIRRKLPTAEYHVSRKIDGEFTVFAFRDGEAITINPGGTVRIGMPWQEEAVAALNKAGVDEALVAGELYADRIDGGRPRVHDVVSAARQPNELSDLRQRGLRTRMQCTHYSKNGLKTKARKGWSFAATWPGCSKSSRNTRSTWSSSDSPNRLTNAKACFTIC